MGEAATVTKGDQDPGSAPVCPIRFCHFHSQSSSHHGMAVVMDMENACLCAVQGGGRKWELLRIP